jgi:oligosaccharide repeat unit polymerase
VILLNPAILYAVTWSAVLLLYAMHLSELLEPLKSDTVLLVAGTSIAFLFGWMLESITKRGKLAWWRLDVSLLAQTVTSDRVARSIRTIWIVFGLGIGFEVVYFGTMPIFGLIGIGRKLDYQDFGIHGLHGFINAMFFAVCVLTFTRSLFRQDVNKSILWILTFSYPVLLVSRQVLISLLLQYLLIYVGVRRPSAKVILRVVVLSAGSLLVFGYLGDLRTGRDNILALGAPSFNYPDWMPSAFIWVYIYVCTPLNNVNNNINIIPAYFPLQTAGTLIPSFARDQFLGSFGSTHEWDLVTESLNANSLLQSLLSDFGIEGAALFSLICGYLFSRLLRRASGESGAFFAVIVVLHGIALSFFANLLFQLIFVAEIGALIWAVAERRRA